MKLVLPVLLTLLALSSPAWAYPIDGYEYSGIRRLDFSQKIAQGEIRGRRQQPGQYLPLAEVLPRWRGSDGRELPPLDAELSAELAGLIDPRWRGEYGVALVDLSDPAAPRYAAHQGQLKANVGSVGKIVVALAVFHELARLHPGDIGRRERVLRETRVVADDYSQYDHHKVPFWDSQTGKRQSRQIRIGDEASLWEYLDWMLSASSNSAGAMVQKELIALRHFGAAYPPPREQYEAFFRDTPPRELGRLYDAVMTEAVSANGLDGETLRQGSFFTRGGNRRVAAAGGSYATPESLVRFLLRVEAGTLVDAFSSRELKRLLYLTQRRIRYASHPALNQAAVYFKSGSFFQCQQRGACGKYKGDKTNRLASVAIVESPAGTPHHHYLVAVMSNVLKVNSAVAHQTLAMRVHRLVERLHPAAQLPPPPPESAYPQVPVDDPGDGEGTPPP